MPTTDTHNMFSKAKILDTRVSTSSIDVGLNNHGKISPDRLEEALILDELSQKKFNLLFAAALKGDSNKVMFLVSEGIGLHSLSPNGWSLVHALACGGQGETLEELLGEGIDINLEGPNGMIPIQLAARASNLNVIKWFTTKGLMTRYLENLDLLHHVAEGNVDKLADEFRDIRGDEEEDIFLHQAITSKYLVEQYNLDINTKNIDNWTPLHLAARNGNTVLMNFLINCGADLNAPGHLDKTPLHEAISGGHLDAVKLLASLGVDLKAPDRSYDACPMRTAVENGQIHIMEYLLEQGIDPLTDNQGGDLISCAMDNMQLHVMKWYSNLGVEIKKYLEDCDGIKLPKLDLEILRWLKSVSFDLTQPLGLTTLMHIAALNGQVDIMEYLRLQGAELDELNHQLMTPVHRAAWKGQLTVLKYLKFQEINLNQEDKYGQTPIFYAIQSGNFEVINYLIENGEDLAKRDKQSNTLLHIAVCQDNISVIYWLLNKGLDVNARNNDGDSPFDKIIKSESQNVNFLRLLEAYGAQVILENIEKKRSEIFRDEEYQSDTSSNKIIQIELIDWFVEHGVSDEFIAEFVLSLIRKCCRYGRIDKLSTLGKKYIDELPWNIGNVQDLIKYAAMHQKFSILTWLEEIDISVTDVVFNLEDDTHNINCQISAAKWIVSHKADANISSTVADKLLKYATKYNNSKAIEFIKNIIAVYGTSDAPEDIDPNFIYNPAVLGDIKLVEKLYMKGLDLNTSDPDGNTLLHHALSIKALDDNLEVIKFLIQNGVDTDVANNFGHSALKLAVDSKKYNIILLLCSLGAKIDIEDENTMSCFLEQEQFNKIFVGENLVQELEAILHVICSYRYTSGYQDSALEKILENKLSQIEAARGLEVMHNNISRDHISEHQGEQDVYSINLDTPKSGNVVEDVSQNVVGEVEASNCCCTIS